VKAIATRWNRQTLRLLSNSINFLDAKLSCVQMNRKAAQMKVWITKYALTSGIVEMEAERCGSTEKMIAVKGESYPQYFHGQDWHENKESALLRAEVMRQKKIASLKKSMKAMEALRFQ